jgi:TonB-linked SusC/RagA family outer membrane protein
MKKLAMLLAFFVFVLLQIASAQTVQITGLVTSSEDGQPLPGASIIIKGTTVGTTTDFQGKYSLSVPSDAKILVISFVGNKSQEIEINGRSIIDATLTPESHQLDEVVVTALGITRDKKSLGYATQEIKGDQISAVKSDNFINAMSGKLAGVQVTKTTNIGGSTNIIIRGSTSLTGNNQALFVVDGVPISNDNTNTDDQSQSGSGYDYGNAASDINPEDVESYNILKGSAATALYGSRAANGVVMITLKKGGSKTKGIGISVNSNVTVGFVDKSTFPEYQKQYGAGYGQYYEGPNSYWYMRDLNHDGIDEQWAVTSEDASYGAKFDPNLMVYQWDAVDPQSPNYMKSTPWVAAKNGPITFFQNPTTYTNSVAIDNTMDNGSYRLSYTNFKQDGLLPNSQLKKNNILLNGTWKVTSKLTATGSANYVKTSGLGRNSTGYNDNIMTSFRQWYQTNVDIKELKDAYLSTGRNVTWNWADPSDAQPIFWDNPYWIRYENYETDNRDRFVGYLTLNYKVTSWLDVFGRASTDFFNGLEEERKAIGTVPGNFGIGEGTDGSLNRSYAGSGYLRRDITSAENNFDLMVNINKNLTEDLNLKAVLGNNIRRTNYNRLISATNGGLGIPRTYSLGNSIDPLPYPKELASKIGVDGLYGNISLGYKNLLYLDGSIRRDHSSTLPSAHSVYYYPAISTSLIFSELLHKSWLGKIRLNYAEVGSGAGFDRIKDSYNINTPLNSPMTAVSTTKNNSDLKPERTKSFEGGLEMYFLNKRAGFDLDLYNKRTVNQILPLALSTATGYNFEIINAGEIQNKGIELTLTGIPVMSKDFKWEINVQWSKNWSKVVSLYPGVDNLVLGNFQGGITINAKVGQPYGIIEGTDYTFANGQHVVDSASGQFIKTSTSDHIIGKVSPDWKGGISNTISYKNWKFSFLIDIQKGGKIFSSDMYYGLATGLYKETAFTNDLGNPVRDRIVGNPTDGYAANSGGFINPGVNVNYDGSITPNKSRIRADRYGAQGYARGLPDVAFVYDAGYVKLREINLTYTLPTSLLKNTFIRGVSLSIVGSNVWIIHKNLPYADPESGLGAGNLQGYSIGSLPSTREFGFDVKLTF